MYSSCIKFVKIVIIVIVLNLFSPVDSVLIKLSDGTIRGISTRTVGARKKIYAFRGIPYAKPPLGKLRFQAPVENDKWSGILDARKDKRLCVQGKHAVIGSEDCLYINVYSPNIHTNNLTVLVWVYGGDYIMGSSTYKNYGPDYLLDQDDIIFVSFNYRIGIFGFFSTGDLNAPGNAGLKDQILALKWVRKNIHKFGGNANSVTIFGQSAGASSISYLLQSDLAKGLYHRAIMDSGTALCRWAISKKSKELAFDIGRHFFGHTFSNSRDLIKVLQKVDFTELQQMADALAFKIAVDGNFLDGLIFGPVEEIEHDGAVISTDSYTNFENGAFEHVPVLMGVNTNEAGIYDITLKMYVYLQKYLADPLMLVPTDMNVAIEDAHNVGNAISQTYLGYIPRLSTPAQIYKWLTDDLFLRPIVKTAKLQSNFNNVYFYLFNYKGELGSQKNHPYSGTVHNEELWYLFRRQLKHVSVTDEDAKMRSVMCRMWTNFAKHGVPTPKPDELLDYLFWPKISGADFPYMEIDTHLSIKKNPEHLYLEFWDKLYDEYGNPPFNSY